MKIARISAWQVDLPLHEGSYKWSGGKSVSVFDSTIVGVETDDGHRRATARSARWGRSTCRPMPRASAPASASWGRTCSAKTRCSWHAEPADGRRAQGPSVRQVGHRHRLLGHPRQGDGPAGLRAAGRPLRRRFRALSRDLAGVAGGDGRPRGRLSRRGLSPVPAQGRRRSRRRHRAHPRRGRGSCSRAIAWSPTPTPAGSCTTPCASCGRCATSTSTSSSPAGPTRSASPSAGTPTIRSCSTRSSTALDVLLRGQADRAMDVVNIKISKFGGLTKAAAGPRPVRLAGDRDDDRG